MTQCVLLSYSLSLTQKFVVYRIPIVELEHQLFFFVEPKFIYYI